MSGQAQRSLDQRYFRRVQEFLSDNLWRKNSHFHAASHSQIGPGFRSGKTRSENPAIPTKTAANGSPVTSVMAKPPEGGFALAGL